MEEKIKTTQMEVPVIDGSKPIFIAVVCVGEDGKAAIAYNVAEGVNISKVGRALSEFGKAVANSGVDGIAKVIEA